MFVIWQVGRAIYILRKFVHGPGELWHQRLGPLPNVSFFPSKSILYMLYSQILIELTCIHSAGRENVMNMFQVLARGGDFSDFRLWPWKEKQAGFKP